MHYRDRSLARALAVLWVGLVVGVAVGTGLVLGSAAPARAAAAGTITVSPNTGPVDTSPMFNLATTSAPCPAAYNTSVSLKIGPAAGPFKTLAPARAEGGYDTAPVSMVPTKSLAKALGVTTVTPGDYLLVLVCGNAQNVEAPQRFETRVTVTGTTWTAESEVAAAVETTTALAVNPAGRAPKGDPVAMTATVTPASAVGAVTFRSGNGTIGTPVAVSRGVATLTVSSLVAGAHQLTAVFGPTDLTAFLPSTSAVVPYQIDVPPAPSPSASVSPSVSVSPSTSVSPSASPSGSPSADPTEDPTEDPTDDPTEDPADDPSPDPEPGGPSATPSPSPVGGTGGGSTLPKTGSAVLPIVAWGLALVLGGTTTMFLTRRRTR